MTDDEIIQLLTVVEVAWPRDRPRGWQKLWRQHLNDLPVTETALAVSGLIRTSAFPPSIAEVREATMDLLGRLPPGDGAEEGLRWSEAWEDSEMQHRDAPAPPPESVAAAVRSFGGPQAVMEDQGRWRMFWRAWASARRIEVLMVDAQKSIGS